MKTSSLSILLSAFGVMHFGVMAYAEDSTPTAVSVRKFDQAVARTEQLKLPLNKIVLYRQAAVALAQTDKPAAVALLRRALSDIDIAEASLKAQKRLDDVTYKQLEFHRLPVLMLMERFDPNAALDVLGPPQSADHDTAFWTLFYSRLNNPELVRQSALHKLDYGASPAVVAAYEVLKSGSPGVARSIATAIVLKLTKSDPEKDALAVQSAFGLLRLLRTDIGSLAPAIVVDPTLLSPESLRDLFSFIADAFVASKDPEMLIVGERPKLYVDAIGKYAPVKVLDVTLLPFAAPGAKSLILEPEKPVVDANHPDPSTLTSEQIQMRKQAKAQIDLQIKDTVAQTRLLAKKIKDRTLTQEDRDSAAFAVVNEANKTLTLARSSSTVLDREFFRDGELEFYAPSNLTNIVDAASSILQDYGIDRPQVAEAAARNFDGVEVQAEVALQIAIREMTGGPAFLVPPSKPPVPVSQGPTAAPVR